MSDGIFNQGGGSSFSFNNPGDVVAGIVQSFKVSQATKFDSQNWRPTNDPDFWPSGDPKMQVQVTLQTDLRESDDDDGLRNIYATITGSPGAAFRAIKDAIKAAGGTDIEEGAWLQVWFAGYDPQSKNPKNPKKTYGANYQRPAAGVFGGDQQVPQSQPGMVGPGGQQVAQGGVQQGQLPGVVQPQQGPPAAAQPPQFQAPAQQPQQGFQPPQFQQAPPAAQPPAQGIDFAAMGQQYRQELQAHQQAQQPPSQGQPGQGADIAAAMMQPPQHHQPTPDPWAGAQNQAQQAQQWEPPRPADMHQPPANPTPQQAQAMQQFYGNPLQAPAAQPPAAAPPAQQPAQQAPQPGATSPAPAGVDMARVQALIAAGLDDEMITQATGVDPATLQMIRNAG